MAKIYGDEKGDKFQWEKLKGEPLKVKLDYIITYYGIMILAGAAIIALAVSLTVSIIRNNIPRVIAGEVLTMEISSFEPDDLKEVLCEKLGLDADDYEIDLTTSYISTSDYEQYYVQYQKIMAQIAAGDTDFFISTTSFMDQFMDPEDSSAGAFKDLSEVLPEDLFEKLEADGRILYYEGDDFTFPYAVNVNDSYLADFLMLPTTENSCFFSVNASHEEAFVEMIKMIYEE